MLHDSFIILCVSNDLFSFMTTMSRNGLQLATTA